MENLAHPYLESLPTLWLVLIIIINYMTYTVYWIMNDNCGEWAESMGVAGGHGLQEVGVASVWNLWVWLECI